MSEKVGISLNVVFEEDDHQECLLYSGETTLVPCKAIELCTVPE